MRNVDLQIYDGPRDSCVPFSEPVVPTRCMRIPFSELLPLLAEAQQRQRSWLRDFDDEMVTISTDLYEVLQAYQHYRRPSA